MKNIKNTVAAMTLAAVLGLGAVSANAGLLLSDRNVNTTSQPSCTASSTSVFDQLTGIIIVGFTSLTGVKLGSQPAPCVQSPADSATGIIIVG